MASALNPGTEKILRAIKARWVTIKSRALRDSFARAALQGFIASGRFDPVDEGRLARMSYSAADAMLLARDGADKE